MRPGWLALLLPACVAERPDTSIAPRPWLDYRPTNPTCLAPPRPSTSWSVSLEPALGGRKFTSPVGMVPSPEGAGWYTVIQQHGEVYRIDDAGGGDTLMITVPDVYMGSSELGLLGFAWHPRAAENRLAYVHYTSLDGEQVRSHVARLHADADFQHFDTDRVDPILQLDQPWENHNGGHLAFGPDGFLYIGFGDGGSGGDPLGNAQNRDVLLGKILRIDVDGGDPYAIPADNPFAAGGGAPEVYAWGLRNPWRFFFDPAGGELWAGDVGQNAWEEFDRIELGGDYGWNAMEGAHCYKPAQDCDTAGKILPVAEYAHGEDEKASITGGPVYRGTTIPGLEGVPLFADVYSGTIFGLVADPLTGEYATEEIVPASGTLPVSFGQGVDGEVFVVDYAGYVDRLVPTPGQPTGADVAFPATLSATGCFTGDGPPEPVEAMFPYEVNVPLWSDGASKARWFAVPDGTTLAVDSAGDLDLPIGSVVAKEFALDGQRVETRLLVRHDDGNWAGYSYRWREDGLDADLLAAAETVQWGEATWHHPGRGECLACHTAATGRTLGLTTPQLDRAGEIGGHAVDDQLAVLTAAGLLDAGLDLPALPAPDSAESLEARARADLDVNCANCHRPGGTGLGAIDLRHDVALADSGLCDATPIHGDLGVEGALVLTPGDPTRSVLSLRMHATDANRMPGLGSEIVDPEGTALVDGWIAGMVDCP
jgi:uncharacterized repeat protein (TIGR03806 family)